MPAIRTLFHQKLGGMIRILAAICLPLTMPAVTSAQDFHRCPDAFLLRPRCLDGVLSITRSSDEWQLRECQRQIEEFVRQMQELQDCYDRTARQASEEAAQRANRAVREFNCIVRGGVLCRENF